MNNEKVKEIKKALELNEYFAIEYVSKSGEPKIFTFVDLLTLINDLESENKWLVGKVKEKVTYIVNNRQQLKNRIAALAKENKDYYDKFNNLQAYIDNHEEIWKGNTNNALKKFAERLKERLYNFQTWEVPYDEWCKGNVICGEIDETLKEQQQ